MANENAHSSDPGEIAELDAELARSAALRIFNVLLTTGHHVTIFAHYHDSTSPGGHLSFMKIQPDGQVQIEQTFHYEQWREVHEVLAVKGPLVKQ